MMTRQQNEPLVSFIARLQEGGIDAACTGVIVREAMGSPTELADAIRLAATQRKIPLLHYILGFEFDQTDRELVAVLCELVRTRDESLGIEDVVEILGEIGDPAAVPCLTQVLTDPPEWDFNGYAGEKAVKALAVMSTNSVHAAIALATTSPRRRVWQATLQPVIDQHDAPLLLFLAQRLLTEDPWSYHLATVLPVVAQIASEDARRILDEASEVDDDENRMIALRLRDDTNR